MGREKFKVYINVYIKRISGLEKLEGRYVYIAWTRGGKIGQSSKQTGLTRKALVRDGVAIFDEHIEFAGTLIQNHKGGFNHKFFTLCLNEFVSSESKKKPFTLKYKMNITEYIKKINENLTANVPMSSEVSLQVVVSSKLISSRVTDGSDSEDENEDDNANANNNGEEEEEEEEGEEDSEGDNAGDEGKEKSKGDDETTKKKKKGKKDDGTKKSKKGDKKKKKKSKGSKKKKGGNNSDNDDDDDDDDGNNNNSDDDMNGDGDNTGSGGTDTLSFGGIYPGFGDFTSPFNEKDNQALIESLKREVDVLKKENKEQEQHIAELKTKTDNLKLLQQSKTTDMDESIVQFKRKEEEAAAAASAANTPQKGRRLVRQVGTMNLMSKTPRKSQASLSLSDSLSGPIQSPSPSSPLTNSSAGDEGSEVEELKDLIKFINTEIYMVQPQVLNGNVPVSSSVVNNNNNKNAIQI